MAKLMKIHQRSTENHAKHYSSLSFSLCPPRLCGAKFRHKTGSALTRRTALLLALILAGVWPAAAQQPRVTNARLQVHSAASGLSFSPYVVVDGKRFAGEPSLYVDKQDGTIWITAVHNNPAAVWKSTDGGMSFHYLPLPYGPRTNTGGDAHAITDGAKRVHIVDQVGSECFYYSRSVDGGKTFSTMVNRGRGQWSSDVTTCKGGFTSDVDRPWLTRYGNDMLYIAYGEKGTGTALDVSEDGGETFEHRVAIPSAESHSGDAPGFVAVDQRTGTLYLTYFVWTDSRPDTLKVAVLAAGGAAPQYHTVISRPGVHLKNGGFPPVAVDSAGNVYVAWGDDSQGTFNVWLSLSIDQGKSWSKPLRINKDNGQHYFPWLVAGNAGRVAVAWWGTTDMIAAPWLGKDAKWYVYASVSTSALTSNPQFDETKVSAEPFHLGSLCARTYTCEKGPKGVEGLPKDFFQIDIDKTGSLYVVWPDTAHYQKSVHAHFAKQVGGPKLYRNE